MSDLMNKFNIVWPLSGAGNANAFRIYKEVQRIMTGQDHGLDRARDFTIWELRLAELVVERIRNGPTLPR